MPTRSGKLYTYNSDNSDNKKNTNSRNNKSNKGRRNRTTTYINNLTKDDIKQYSNTYNNNNNNKKSESDMDTEPD